MRGHVFEHVPFPAKVFHELTGQFDRVPFHAADAYAAFEEARLSGDVDGKITGLKYRQAILESGGSRPAMASFKAFRGREPQLDALLRHQGMA